MGNKTMTEIDDCIRERKQKMLGMSMVKARLVHWYSCENGMVWRRKEHFEDALPPACDKNKTGGVPTHTTTYYVMPGVNGIDDDDYFCTRKEAFTPKKTEERFFNCIAKTCVKYICYAMTEPEPMEATLWCRNQM